MYKRLWMPSGATPVVLPPSTQMEKLSHSWTKLSIVDMAWHNDTCTDIWLYMRSLIFHSVLRTLTRTRFVPAHPHDFEAESLTTFLGSKLLAGLAVLVTYDAIRASLGSTMEARWGEVSPTKNITKSVPYDAARRSTTIRTALALCNSWKESLEVLEKWINMTDCAKDCSDDVDMFSDIGYWYRNLYLRYAII